MKELFLIKDKSILSKINIFWLLSIFSIMILSLFSEYVFDFHLYEMEKLFDVEHYLYIAKNGYTQYHQVAFFPLFPLIMRFFNLFEIPILGTVILNNILCLLSAYIIYNILNNLYGVKENMCIYGVLFWLMSPIRIFTFVPYTESLYIFLSLICFYLYKKRSNPLLLGICMGLSVATRNMGCIEFFVIFAFLFIEMITTTKNNEKKERFKYIVITYIPATIISCLYPIYLQFLTGNWRCFIDVQYQLWGRDKGNIIKVLLFDIFRLSETTRIEVFIMIILTYISLILAIGFILCSLLNEKGRKLDLILITIISILVIFSTYRNVEISAGSTSFFRYIYGLMPMYLLLDDNLSETLVSVILGLNTFIFAIVTFMFLGNMFIA